MIRQLRSRRYFNNWTKKGRRETSWAFSLNTAEFHKWVDENIVFIESLGKYVSLKSICKSFLNKESPHSSEMTQIKQSMERYIKKRFNIRPETAEKYKYNQIRFSDSKNKIRGWKNTELRSWDKFVKMRYTCATHALHMVVCYKIFICGFC